MKVAQSCLTLCHPMDCSPWTSPGWNTGVGSLSRLHGIFLTQGLNPGLPRCRWILYQLSHKGYPRILEWVAYPFSSRSSQPRNWTGVSYIADRFFTNWAIREALINYEEMFLKMLICYISSSYFKNKYFFQMWQWYIPWYKAELRITFKLTLKY